MSKQSGTGFSVYMFLSGLLASLFALIAGIAGVSSDCQNFYPSYDYYEDSSSYCSSENAGIFSIATSLVCLSLMCHFPFRRLLGHHDRIVKESVPVWYMFSFASLLVALANLATLIGSNQEIADYFDSDGENSYSFSDWGPAVIVGTFGCLVMTIINPISIFIALKCCKTPNHQEEEERQELVQDIPKQDAATKADSFAADGSNNDISVGA
jgi:hypothetical protein